MNRKPRIRGGKEIPKVIKRHNTDLKRQGKNINSIDDEVFQWVDKDIYPPVKYNKTADYYKARLYETGEFSTIHTSAYHGERTSTFKAIIDYTLYSGSVQLYSKLLRWVDDVERENDYAVDIISCNNCSQHTIRENILRPAYLNENLVGVLLIGNIPSYWMGDYGYGDELPTSHPYSFLFDNSDGIPNIFNFNYDEGLWLPVEQYGQVDPNWEPVFPQFQLRDILGMWNESPYCNTYPIQGRQYPLWVTNQPFNTSYINYPDDWIYSMYCDTHGGNVGTAGYHYPFVWPEYQIYGDPRGVLVGREDNNKDLFCHYNEDEIHYGCCDEFGLSGNTSPYCADCKQAGDIVCQSLNVDGVPMKQCPWEICGDFNDWENHPWSGIGQCRKTICDDDGPHYLTECNTWCIPEWVNTQDDLFGAYDSNYYFGGQPDQHWYDQGTSIFHMDIFVGWLKTNGCNSSEFIEWGGEIHDGWEGIPDGNNCLDWEIAGFESEVDALINYFDKNHEYRTNFTINVEDNNMLFYDHVHSITTDRFEGFEESWTPDLMDSDGGAEIFDMITNTHKSNYLTEFNKKRLVSTTYGHSGPWAKAFNIWDGSDWDWLGNCSACWMWCCDGVCNQDDCRWPHGNVFYWDIVDMETIPYFNFEIGCATGRFTEMNNIANWQVFHPGGGLVTIAAADIVLGNIQQNARGYYERFSYMYKGLNQGMNVGEAFKYNHDIITEWYWETYTQPNESFQTQLIANKNFALTEFWNILGDPTLRFPQNVNVMGDIDSSNTLSVADLTAFVNWSLGHQELTNEQQALLDLNFDGNADIFDMIILLENILYSGNDYFTHPSDNEYIRGLLNTLRKNSR